MAPLYLAELGRRNRRFDRGEGVVRLGRPVISVGNISVGGVGKTPMVMTIVGWLLGEGRRPCVAMRGYRSAQSAEGESDEAVLYRERFGDVPVVVGADRVAGLRALFARELGATGSQDGRAPHASGASVRTDCIVLDDGFQHRRIARELDIALVDATRDPFADRALPAGWLREPASALARADAVVLTHAEAAGEEAVARIGAQVAEVCGKGPVAVTRHEWRRLRVIEADGAERVERPAWLVGRRVVVGCAIGNAEAFVRGVREAVGEAGTGSTDVAEPTSVARGGAVAGALVLRDHDTFGPKAVSRLIGLAREHRAEAIVVTAKDWTKLSRVERLRWPAPVVVAELGLAFVRGEEALRELVIAAAEPRAQG